MEKTITQSQADKKSNNQGNHIKLIDVLLFSESPRTQEIVKKRYGLSQKKMHTLEKIGQDHGITRERVRQIISDAISRLAKKRNEGSFMEFEEKISLVIKENDGIIKEDVLMDVVGCADPLDRNAISFLGMLSDRVVIIDKKEEWVSKSWANSADVLNKVKKIRAVVVDVLAEKKNGKNNLWQENEIVAEIKKRIGEVEVEVTHKEISSHLDVLSEVAKSKFGKWGMAHWDEISPKGTRERIHLVLKESKKPLHFKEIAKLIDQYGLSNKKAHPQTVHNELIKDDKFVLIGRGIYALQEWGYKRGTIREVLKDILKNSKKSLTKEEIFSEVLKLRKVKKATVMINLNNPNFFKKIGNTYALKK